MSVGAFGALCVFVLLLASATATGRALLGDAHARSLKSVDDGAWIEGRATNYGQDAWSIHKGSCGYGYISPNSITGWDVAAVCQRNSDFSGSCGRCYEVQCRDGDVKDAHAPNGIVDRSSACYASEAKSVVVKTVDRCDCYYPPNLVSNRRWCCGDMPHMDLSYWAFQKLASPNWGVIPVRWREVPCDRSGNGAEGINVRLDPGTGGSWVGIEIINSNYPVQQVWVTDAKGKADGQWFQMENVWGATYGISAVSVGWPQIPTPLSLKLTAEGSGEEIEVLNVITGLAGDQQFHSVQQFSDNGAKKK